MVLVNFNPTLTKIASETKLIINAKQQTRNQGGAGGAKPLQENFLPPLEKCVGYSLKLLDIVQKIWAPLKKNWGPSQKTLRPSWCPKPVTGLLSSKFATFGI